MSRKDTIIIAVLINAGLLLILFATAISSSNEEDIQPSTTPLQIASADELPPLSSENLPTVPGDEVDQVLSQWSSSSAANGANSRPYQGSQIASSASPITLGYRSDACEEDSVEDSDGEVPTLRSISSSAPSVNSVKSFKEIKVQKGDILERIAKANGTTVQEIMKVNKLSNTQLKIGQVLKIPANSASETASSNTHSPSSSKDLPARSSTGAQPQYYVVKSGDNPWLIAKKNHMALDELLRLNSLDEGKARRLQPGDKIRIK